MNILKTCNVTCFCNTSTHSFIPRIVTVACAELHPSSTGAGALAELTPRTPVSILLYDVRGQPNAVTFEAMLQQTKNKYKK